MARQLICDICKRPTEKIAGKLFLLDLPEPSKAREKSQYNYNMHADVGDCCMPRLKKSFNFKERKKNRKSENPKSEVPNAV